MSEQVKVVLRDALCSIVQILGQKALSWDKPSRCKCQWLMLLLWLPSGCSICCSILSKQDVIITWRDGYLENWTFPSHDYFTGRCYSEVLLYVIDGFHQFFWVGHEPPTSNPWGNCSDRRHTAIDAFWHLFSPAFHLTICVVICHNHTKL